jgi:hypothetical protein
MFALKFRERLQKIAGVLVEELDQLLIDVDAYLLVEHKGDGSHSDVTADSVTVENDVTAGGDGTFDGNVTADADGTAVEIGNGVGGGGDYFGAPGIRFTYSSTHDWAVLLGDNNYSGASRPGMIWHDPPNVAATGTAGFLALYRSTAIGVINAEYHLIPATSVSLIYLGADTLGRRIAALNCFHVRANDGYYERGRTVMVGDGETPTFAAGNYTASGVGITWPVLAGQEQTSRFSRSGSQLFVDKWIVGSNVLGGAPAELNIALPAGLTAAVDQGVTFQAIDAGGAATVGWARIVAGESFIRLQSTVGGAGWTATAGANTTVRLQMRIEVVG